MPPPCHVCDRPVPSTRRQLTPERNPSLAASDDDRFYHWCPVCLDAFLAVLPLAPAHLYEREATGRAPWERSWERSSARRVSRTTRRWSPTSRSHTNDHIAPTHEGHVRSPA